MTWRTVVVSALLALVAGTAAAQDARRLVGGAVAIRPSSVGTAPGPEPHRHRRPHDWGTEP